MRFNPKARLDTEPGATTAAAAAAAAAASPMRRRRRRHQGRRRHRRPDRHRDRPGAERQLRRLRRPGGPAPAHGRTAATPSLRPAAGPARTPTRTPTAPLVAVRELDPAFWADELPRRPASSYADARRRSSPARSAPAAAARPPRSGRSTARPTSSLPRPTSSRTCSQSQLGASGGRSRRPTCSPTSTATTCRTCSARGKVPRPAGPQQRRGAPRAAGRLLRRRLDQDATTADDAGGEPYILDLTQDDIAGRSTRRPRSATTGSSARPRAASTPRLDARLGRVSGSGGSPRGCRRAPSRPATPSPPTGSETLSRTGRWLSVS